MPKVARKHVLRMEEAELEQLPDMPHHHGGWTVRDLVRKAGLADLPMNRLPVDVVQMSHPSSARTAEDRLQGTQAWQRNP